MMEQQEKPFEYLENIINLLPGHVYWLNRDHIYFGCNELQAKAAGLSSPIDIIGKRNSDLPWLMNSAQLQVIDKINEEVMATGLPLAVEESILSLNGKETIFLSHKSPIRSKLGEVIGLFGISIDITNRKANEAKLLADKELVEITLEHIISNMPGHVYWKDRQGIILGCNERQAHSSGFKSSSEFIGKNSYELFLTEDEIRTLKENDILAMVSGQLIIVEEFNQKHDKKTIYLSNKVPLKDKSNNVIGILGISLDITERKTAEEELQKAKLKADVAVMLMNKNTVKILMDKVKDRKISLNVNSQNIPLSTREAQCLLFLLRGETAKSIAREMNISPRTVESYIETMKSKMGVTIKAELAQRAIEGGLLDSLAE